MAPVGAALLAGVGAGVFKDIYEASDKVDKHVYKVVKSSDKHKDVYEKRYQVYTKLDVYKRQLQENCWLNITWKRYLLWQRNMPIRES